MINEAFAGTIPLQGSDIAARWDNLYLFLVLLSLFFFVLVIGGMIYFTFAYRHKPGVKTKYITGHHLLEAFWIAIPTLLLLMIFGWGYSVYHSMSQAPSDAYEVRVIAKQWLWTFQYDDGRTSINEVFVPVNRPVKFIMTSEDVLHSFFIPNFRIKQDVVPGMYSSVWFTATVPGKHQVFCAEYCGTSHSGMLAKVVALTDDQWNAWKRHKALGPIPEAGQEGTSVEQASSQQGSNQGTQLSLVEQGKALTETKGCVACHTADGTIKIGPSYKGLYGSKSELADGKVVTVDDNFIKSHIENPRGTPVKGFPAVMPPFQGLLTETEINAIIAYIKSLK